MPKTTTIYLSDKTLATIGQTDNLSGRIADIVGLYGLACQTLGVDPHNAVDAETIVDAMIRFRRIMAAHTPSLTESEWCAIVDVLNGVYLCAEPDIAHALADEISEAAAEGIDKKWGINLDALVERLRGLDYTAKCAVIEVVRRFWAGSRGIMSDIRQQLIAAGARIEGAE